jgi:eukaryotic-like serine/threonine-protein kinase
MGIRTFQFGEWLVESETCTLTHATTSQSLTVEPRAMDVLVTLCSQAGQVLSSEDLLRRCWDGLVVGENQVHKAVAQLRRTLGDRADKAIYIENIRKRGYRTVALVKELPKAFSEVPQKDWMTTSPFVGLDAFTENHSPVFFGRDEAIERLREALVAQIYSGRSFVLVLGASGSGKTSLIQAGLLPALRTPGGPILVVGSSSFDLADIGEIPLMIALGGALLDIEVDGETLLAGESAESIGAALAETDWERIVVALRRATHERPDRSVALFVDRLESVFNDAAIEESDRSLFLSALDRLASAAGVSVIAACRNDFYSEVAKQPVLMKSKSSGGHFDLGPATRAEIAQMIRMPALVAGLDFGVDPETKARLDDILCDATADNPDALPLLQYTLQELYLQRSSSRELTLATYRELGGIEGAIGRRAEATLNGLPEASTACLNRILSLVVTVGDESVRSRRISWSALTDEDERKLVRTLVEQRLFVTLNHDGQSVFGVSHEALLRQWSRATAWISDHRQALHTRGRLEVSAKRWVIEGRPSDLLIPKGKLLEEARELLRFTEIPLNQDVTALISASIRKVKHAERMRIGALVGFAVIALIALMLGVLARRAQTTADRHRQEAEGLMDFMLGELADRLRPLGRLDVLEGIGRKSLSYFAQVEPTDLPPAAREQQARALQTIGEVARSRADPKAARQALLLAKTLLEANLKQGYESVELLKDLGADSFWLGQISLDEGRLDDAEGSFQQYQRYSERMMVLEPQNVDAWIEVSYATNSLGSVAQSRGDNLAAAAAFERSVELKRRAVASRPDDHVLRAELADSLSWLGSARQADGELGKALALFEQEQAELRALRAKAPTELRWTYRSVAAAQRHARLLAATGDATAAAAEMRDAKHLAQDLIQQDPTNRVWQRSLLNVEVLDAEFQADLGNFQAALNLQTATAASLAKLTHLDPTNQDWVSVELANLLHLGESLLRLGRPQEARDRLQNVLDRMRKAKNSLHRNAQFDEPMAFALIDFGQAQRALGNEAEALRACYEAIEIVQPLVRADTRDYDIQDPWIRAHLCVGQRESVTSNMGWLHLIGYRQPSYLRSVLQTP